MPAYLRGYARETTVAVRAISANVNTFYAFKPKDLASLPGVSATDIAPLGHLDVGGLPDGSLIFFRASAPKPPRCRKVIERNPGVNQQGSISTFFSQGRQKEVIAAGWDLGASAKAVNLKTKARYVTAIAELENGALYCFPMNRSEFDNYRGVLGLKSPADITNTVERQSLVMGSSRPRPAKVGLDLNDGSSFSSFASDSALDGLAEQGFYQIKGAVII